MSLTVTCRCGKKYQLKAGSAGKKFKCKECDRTVTVPDEQLDDLEDVDDYEEEPEEERAPVRRKKRRRSSSMGDGKALRVFGLITGIVGYIGSVLYFIAALTNFVLMMLIMSAAHRPQYIFAFFIIRIAIALVMGVVTWFAARAACGAGTDGKVDDWASQSRIITGMVIIILPWLLWVYLYFNSPGWVF